MKKKFDHLLKIICLILLPLSVISCDSGDIYPDEYIHDEGITVEASYIFQNLGAFPNNYPLIFGFFNDEQTTPLASVRIMKPRNDDPVVVSLDNLPDEAKYIRLCLTDMGRQPVYIFYEQKIDGVQTENMVLPEYEVNLLKYSRIQELVFEQYTCVACHQGNKGAANLLLTEGKSFSALVNQPSSILPSKNRVTPDDLTNSFLMDVLQTENAGLTQPHTGFITRPDDITLLEEWIKSGAKRN